MQFLPMIPLFTELLRGFFNLYITSSRTGLFQKMTGAAINILSLIGTHYLFSGGLLFP